MESKYIGALKGAAVGDALGWPNEQNSKNINKYTVLKKDYLTWQRKCGGRYWPYEETVKEGEYSDDTQLLIATLRSLLKKAQWSTYFRQIELPAWISYERGGGGATKRAASCWAKGYSPWDVKMNEYKAIKSYFMAGGNGVVMRIMPHVFCNEKDTDIIMKQVLLNGMYTHGHPRALVGALLYAYSLKYLFSLNETLRYGELIQYLIKEKEVWGTLPLVHNLEPWKNCSFQCADIVYDNLWKETVEETVNSLEIAKTGMDQGILDIGNDTLIKLGCFDKKINGAGNVTAVISIYLFCKYASNPKLGIMEAVNLKNADTDTVASLTGGLFGALYGEDWIPLEYRILQDYSMFDKLVEKLVKEKDDIIVDSSNYKLYNKDTVSKLKKGDTINVLPFGTIRLEEIRNEKVLYENIYATTYISKTTYGQTIFTTKVGRIKNKKDISQNLVTANTQQNKILVGCSTLLKIADILISVEKTIDFIQIIQSLSAVVESNKPLSDVEINSLKETWKVYRLTKKQISAVYNILKKNSLCSNS